MSHWSGAKVEATVAAVTSAEDYELIALLKNRSYDLASKMINEDRVGTNAVDEHGASALVIAVQTRQKVLAASLLNAYNPSVDVDFATPSGYTALHFAPDSGGWGPLHFACRFGNLDLAQDLLDFDADPMLLGHAGESAFQVAEDAAVDYTRKARGHAQRRPRQAGARAAGGEL
ncbi:hypothetical protein JL722_13429 [Aureococcus anophagefferens]|nr:hypothetical protein JL722_13429 [Aureococcus anophagefferens]